jgi:hypothetical protein
MDDELISKKELLELTGISYGQLYRWKRKNLVPEDWFIRKSVFTGQETFFPKQRILARIDKIMNMKEDLSLDELAEVFSPMPSNLEIQKNELVKRNIVTRLSLDAAEHVLSILDVCSFEQTIYVYMLDHVLQSGMISLDEGNSLLQTLRDHYAKFEGKASELVFIRKMGVSAFALIPEGSELFFENGVHVVFRIRTAKIVEELKVKLSAV